PLRQLPPQRPRLPRPRPLFPYTTLFRSLKVEAYAYTEHRGFHEELERLSRIVPRHVPRAGEPAVLQRRRVLVLVNQRGAHDPQSDRKSTRLNSSHVKTSYAVFCSKNTSA